MIVPMKKAVIVCWKQEREALLKALQQCGELMPIRSAPAGESPAEAVRNEAPASTRERQAGELLKRTKPYQPKKKPFSGRPEVGIADFLSQSGEAERLQSELGGHMDALAGLEAERTALQTRRSQLTPWLELDTPAEELAPTEYTVVLTGYLPQAALAPAQATAGEQGAKLAAFGTAPEGVAAVVICCRGEEGELLEALKAAGFVEAGLPVRTGTSRAELERLNEREAELRRLIDAENSAITELAKRADELRLLADQYRAESERESAPVEETTETVYIEGWVRSDRTDRLERAIRRVTEVYDLTLLDPAPEESPPTVTKNNRFIAQFETITDMFSRPHYGDLDPNPVMAPWYWIIFGMMMGDVGYGALMVLLIFGFKKLMKPRGDMAKLVNVLFYSGFTSILFGVLFGSYFGESWNPILFGPLDNPIGMLILSMAVGVLHIFTGMILKMVSDIRAGHLWDALFDQLTWILIITGLCVFGGGMALGWLQLVQNIGIALAAIGAVTILLTGGRNKKGFGKITGGVMGLYNITSFLSDILSYARIMALGLATGVIGMVMNLLAGMVSGIPVAGILFAIVVYIIGHGFNLAMSLLSAYVHDSRLQYIEFYGKFYEGGGTEFKPLAIRTQYVDLTGSEPDSQNKE